MHLGNGALTPECAAITWGAAAIGLSAAAASLRSESISRQKLALAATLGTMVFAAQAINVQVLPGTSAHLVGGVLAAWMLGPGLGAWTMAIVLAVQALVLGDGALAALGANTFNMALLPAASVAAIRRLQLAEGRWSHLTAAVVAAACVPLAALLIVGETALFRSGAELAGWSEFAARMIGAHLWIGMLEGGVTLAIVSALAWCSSPAHPLSWRTAVVSAVMAAALAGMAPWSSSLPDGYQAAAQSWSALSESR
jgi:cobalt/nickel transport system permease protein